MQYMRGYISVLALIAFAGCGTARTVDEVQSDTQETYLSLLVDAEYTLSHGWGHVFECKIKDVLNGELDDTVVYVSVYGTTELYGELLLPFKDYEDLMLGFMLNPERTCGPPPGFRDSEGRYWDLHVVIEHSLLTLSFLPNLADAFDGCYGWRDFEGKASIYRYDSFPDIHYHHYRYPDPKKWVAGLKPGGTCDSMTGYVQVWKENGKVRFIWITEPYPNGGRFFAFRGDTIDAATPINSEGLLFMTEVGICKWRYIYSEGLLSKIAYYRINEISPVWAVDSVKYWKDTNIPRYIYRYVEPEGLDIAGLDWDSRIVFDREGKRLREEKK